MHDAAGPDAGDTVTVEITRAGEEPETGVPLDLRKAIEAAAAGGGIVGGYHANRAPGLDSLDKLSQANGNRQAPGRERLRHACIWKATSMLFRRYKVAYEGSRDIRRNMASVAEFKKSFFAEIDKFGLATDQELRQVCGSWHMIVSGDPSRRKNSFEV